MTPRDVALTLLSRIEKDGAYIDRVITSPDVTNLTLRDRSFVRELLYGVMRWKLLLDRIIDMYYFKRSSKLDNDIRNILRLGLFQLLFMNTVPDHAAVDESVKSAVQRHNKGAGGLTNALLRRFIREGKSVELPSEQAERLSCEFSTPLWIVKRWINAFGTDSTESMVRASTEKHSLYVRPGKIGVSADSLSESLAHNGFEAKVVGEMTDYLEISRGNGLFDTAAFMDGLFTVQDPPAGIATYLLAPKQGETVLDLCAAPGGKTTHIAHLMQNSGHIDAVDRNKARLGLIKETAERLKFTSIDYVTGDALDFGRDTKQLYDRVLLDAPCSGTGVFAKRPDMKWRLTADDIPRLADLQRSMLDNAAGLVRPGGVLVYSTCTLEHEENEDTVNEFLHNNSEYYIEHDERFEPFAYDCGYLIRPHEMKGTGAFSAKLRRN